MRTPRTECIIVFDSVSSPNMMMACFHAPPKRVVRLRGRRTGDAMRSAKPNIVSLNSVTGRAPTFAALLLPLPACGERGPLHRLGLAAWIAAAALIGSVVAPPNPALAQ